MSNYTFTREDAMRLLESEEEFSVDLDDAWKWLGYPSKDKGKKILYKKYREGVDFVFKGLKSSRGGNKALWIVLTLSCFKSLAEEVNKGNGSQVKKVLIECNKLHRFLLSPQTEPTEAPLNTQYTLENIQYALEELAKSTEDVKATQLRILDTQTTQLLNKPDDEGTEANALTPTEYITLKKIALLHRVLGVISDLG